MSRVPGAGRFVVLAVLLVAVQPLTSATPPAASAATATTSLTLTSAGSDGAAAQLDSGQAVLAADGTQTAFTSTAGLKTTASVRQTPGSGDTGRDRIYGRNRLTGATTLLSDTRTDSTAPAISDTGRLVAYYQATDELVDDGQIDVVDRLATGKGRFDTPGNLVLHQATGNQRDPRFQRLPFCPFGDEGATGRCGPALSQDGSTLAYPAQLSPVSPALRLFESNDGTEDPVTGNVVDMVPTSEMVFNGGTSFDTEELSLDVVNVGAQPITFTGLPSVTAPFTVGGASCGNREAPVLAAGARCLVNLQFDATANCAHEGSEQLFTGDLTTDATTPAGQLDVTVVAACSPERNFSDETPRIPAFQSTVPSAVNSVAAPCPPVPAGLPVVAAPEISADSTDNKGTDLVDNGPVEIGRPEIAWTTVTGFGELDFTGPQAPDCSLGLVDPSTVRTGDPLPTDVPPPCANGQDLGSFEDDEPVGTSCTAYFLVEPQRLATAAGLLTVTDFECAEGCDTKAVYVSATGFRHVIVARRGPNFAASRGTVVSVDGAGHPIPGAGEPTLSANGRYVGFTAPVPLGQAGQQPVSGSEVWRHDTDAAGDGTHHPGATILVSCLPGAGACRRATTAAHPSISGDGTRVAFLGQADQVYVRETSAGTTVLVSADRGRGTTPSNGAARDPVLSPDGSTVAFGSLATDLLGPPRAGGKPVANLFLADIGPGTPGILLVTPAGSQGARPSLDAHGRLVAFETPNRLLPSAPSEVDSVYTFERFGDLVVSPGAVSYGRLVAGLPGQSRGVTVTNTGPGPVTFTGVRITGPYVLTLESCAGAVLHRGQTCRAIILFRPASAGHPTGVLTWTTADDGEPPQHTDVDVTATVVVPTVPLLTVSPTVAYGGEVVRATGVAFPANTTITLTWSQGLGTAMARTNASGQFSVAVVLFPDDVLGQRQLLATGPTGSQLAATKFLAAAAPEEPPFHRPAGQ